MYNFGCWDVRTNDPESERYQGDIQMLVASYQIDQRYNLNIREAWGELNRLYGPDENSWPTEHAHSSLLPES